MNCVLASILLAGAALELSTASFAGPPFLQAGPDLSGRWTRESASGPAEGAGSNAGWGPSVAIEPSDDGFIVRRPNEAPERYRTDGTEIWTRLSSERCKRQSRVTKTVATATSVTITTWLITQPNCFHGEQEFSDFEPISPPATTSIRPTDGGVRRLESITVVSRSDGRLSVEKTQAGLPGQPPTTTRTDYRK